MENLLQPHTQLDKQTTIELTENKEQKKEIKLLSSLKSTPNHILWSFNLETCELKKAEFAKVDHFINFSTKSVGKNKKVVVEENCTYFQALNRVNAEKKLRKLGFIS